VEWVRFRTGSRGRGIRRHGAGETLGMAGMELEAEERGKMLG